MTNGPGLAAAIAVLSTHANDQAANELQKKEIPVQGAREDFTRKQMLRDQEDKTFLQNSGCSIWRICH